MKTALCTMRTEGADNSVLRKENNGYLLQNEPCIHELKYLKLHV